MVRYLFRSAPIALVAVGLSYAPGARAELPPAPAPATGQAPARAPQDDTRFGEIGHAEAESSGSESPRVAAGIGGTQVGHVTYAGARVDVPLSRRWSIIPQAAILRVQPFHDGDPVTTNVYVGAGVGWHPADTWTVEASGTYGPQAWGLSSVGGALSIAKEVGADWANDVGPWVVVEGSLSATRFAWQDGNGPAGPNVTQGYLEAQAAFAATHRFTITPKGMLFVYDHSLDQARGERLGTVSTLARIGTYAPQAMIGVRLGYLLGTWLTPFVEGQEIDYAASIGTAQRLVAGARAKLGRDAYATLLGGAILNHVGGPLVAPDEIDSLKTVPVVGAELEWAF